MCWMMRSLGWAAGPGGSGRMWVGRVGRRIRTVIWVIEGWERARRRASEPAVPVAPVRINFIERDIGWVVAERRIGS